MESLYPFIPVPDLLLHDTHVVNVRMEHNQVERGGFLFSLSSLGNYSRLLVYYISDFAFFLSFFS